MLEKDDRKSLATELARIDRKLKAKSQTAELKAYDLTNLSAFSLDKISTQNLDILCKKFELSSFERDVLLLCFGVEIYSHWLPLCGDVLENLEKDYVTFKLALSILDEPDLNVLSSTTNLERLELINIEPSLNFSYSRIALDKQVFQHIIGLKHCEPDLLNTISPLNIEALLAESHQKVVQNLYMRWVSSANLAGSIFLLLGKDLSSKKAIVKVLCSDLDKQVYTVSSQLLLEPTLELDSFAKKIAREWLLNDSILLLNCEEIDTNDLHSKLKICQFINHIKSPLIVTSKELLFFERKETISFQIDLPSTLEQKLLWKEYLKEIVPELNGQIERIVSHFSFSSPSICNLSNQLKILNKHNSKQQSLKTENLNGKYLNRPQKGNNEMADRLWDICRTFARPHLDELAARIDSKVSWSELVIGEQEQKTLKEIVAHVRHRSKVYENWGFDRKSSRGLGISALFAGSSGTGKTLAAEVLGNELNLDVYRIDLSTVVSKYIGETEKNLRKIFDRAENCGVILLFDEADALFGRRSEVKDSHDRYANMEISYLLQRIETYRGLAILTTNLKQDIDRAFMRRIRFVIDFEFPDRDMREAIWRRIFPKQTPTQDLDYKKLANLSLPGGNIRNIALKAAFLAANQGENVQMKHLLKATESECYKLNRITSDREIKGWVD